jgi:hypothetical protein
MVSGIDSISIRCIPDTSSIYIEKLIKQRAAGWQPFLAPGRSGEREKGEGRREKGGIETLWKRSGETPEKCWRFQI